MILQQNELNSSSSEHLKSNKLFTNNNLGSKKQHHTTMSNKASQLSSNSNLKLDSINSLLASSSTNMKPSKIPIYNSTSFEKFKTSYNTNNNFINARIKNLKSNSKQFDQSPLLEQSILNFNSSQNGFTNNNANSNIANNRPKLEKQEFQPETQQKKPSIFQKTSKLN
jgi:hypothetical protein